MKGIGKTVATVIVSLIGLGAHADTFLIGGVDYTRATLDVPYPDRYFVGDEIDASGLLMGASADHFGDPVYLGGSIGGAWLLSPDWASDEKYLGSVIGGSLGVSVGRFTPYFNAVFAFGANGQEDAYGFGLGSYFAVNDNIRIKGGIGGLGEDSATSFNGGVLGGTTLAYSADVGFSPDNDGWRFGVGIGFRF